MRNLTRKGFTLFLAFRYKSTHTFVLITRGLQVYKICCPFAEIHPPRGLECLLSHAPCSFRLDWREGETYNRGAVNGGGKRGELKLGEPGCGGEGKRSPTLFTSCLDSLFSLVSLLQSCSFDQFRAVLPKSQSFFRLAMECSRNGWVARFQSSWPRSRSEWASTKLMPGLNCLLHLFGVNFNLRNVQFSNDKWSNL